MNQKSPWFGLLITLGIISIIYLGYYFIFSKGNQIIIDNPTEKKIEIIIDSEPYKISKQQWIELNLKEGEHKISYHLNQNKIDTIIKISSNIGILNPTRADYYIFRRPYGVADKDSLFTSNSITIDEKVYHGAIEKNNNLWIDDFSIGLNENYPNLVKKPNKDSITRISKIFRKDAFKQFYFENYE